jgi:uncharacterized protein (AIM24 family)
MSLDVRSFFQRSRAAAPEERVNDFGFAELRGGGSRVSIVPALGGKIAQLELGGRTVAVDQRRIAVHAA